MKVVYNIKPSRGEYDPDKFFTYGKTYEVLADYRERSESNGFVVIDNMNQQNMLFKDQVKITDETKGNTYIF